MIAVCLKWLAEPGAPGDERFGGISLADEAALELALQHGELLGTEVVAVSCGGPESITALRQALARGAARAARVDAPASLDSAAVARSLATVVADATFVWCGDVSADRGSGSVPAFLAARLGARQALGVVDVTLGDGAAVEAVRRLDGGRREVLRATAPCVVSVEGGVARLRRAGLAATLRAADAPIDETVPDRAPEHAPAGVVRPYRPRARALAAPHGDTLGRLRQLTDAGGAPTHGERVTLDPPAAAARIVAALREWGYLP
ncbi:MAG: hypothetical protein QM733_00370 [Ilumatobacteraceae bacterium]